VFYNIGTLCIYIIGVSSVTVWSFSSRSCPRCGESHAVNNCNAENLKCINCLNSNSKTKSNTRNSEHAAWDYQKCGVHKQMIDKTKQDVFGPML
jgi:hypothetical protein